MKITVSGSAEELRAFFHGAIGPSLTPLEMSEPVTQAVAAAPTAAPTVPGQAPPEAFVPAADPASPLFQKGKDAFTAFLKAWCVGLHPTTYQPLDGVEQPDRERLLRDTSQSKACFALLAYIRAVGGLQHAIFAVTGDKALARSLGGYITPPASILFHDLADTFEYNDPFGE